uniref:Uncharacterized protein n=1 Tax=Periophthalmus magnuspinnatus TaxID=409849 RepID=A0A3B4AFU7_9GOBI
MDEENGSKADLQLDTFGETDDGTFGGDDRSSIQAEDELRTKEKTPTLSAQTPALSAHTPALSAHTASVKGGSAASNPETVVNFLRSFLCQMEMIDTLDCFEAEWYDMVKNGQIDANRVDMMPNVYIQNRHLENELKNVQKEIEVYSQTITALFITFVEESWQLK